jgi:hypothetical protein
MTYTFHTNYGQFKADAPNEHTAEVKVVRDWQMKYPGVHSSRLKIKLVTHTNGSENYTGA